MRFTFAKMPTGGFSAAGISESGVPVQLVAIDRAVMIGWKPRGEWINVVVSDPDRFGSDRSTLKAWKAWVAAYEGAAA